MAGSRSTEAEVSHRIEEVAKWLAEGLSRQEMCEKARKTWDISASQLDRYASHARQQLAATLRDDGRVHVAVAHARFERLYGLAIQAGNVALAEKVLRDQVATLGAAKDGFGNRPWMNT